MQQSPGGAVGRLALAFAVTAAALLAAGSAQAASAPPTYIVQLKLAPLASYRGGTARIPATSPKVTGRKLDERSAAARAYAGQIAAAERAAIARAPGSIDVLYRYRTAFAGFAARLTPAQVGALRRAPQVARVTRDRLFKPQQSDPVATLDGPQPSGDGASYLRLTTDLWQRTGGPESATGPGAGVIVGDLDTGIQPGHPSFADHSDGSNYLGADFPPPGVWRGTCQSGPGFPATACNNKLIGARFFVAGFGVQNLDTESFISPRDDDGHGSHTAGTAAGNYGVDPVIAGSDLRITRISGIAPRAYVAAYKVCWVGNGDAPSGCSNADSVDAIDAAVADGVDVINYSIGSSGSAVIGPVEIAFLGASDAGVFVSNSAGNDGPGPQTVGSPTSVPWLTSVGADTLHRTFSGTAVFSGVDGTITGASVTAALPVGAEVVNAADSSLAGEDATLCRPGTLDPAKVAGKVVVCRRGVNARIDKSHNVFDAGGVGMVLYNASDAQELVTDTHFVPAIHVSRTDGDKLLSAIAAGRVTVQESTAGAADYRQPGAVLAAFSSRGPQTAVPDIAKPDVTAPGVNILAAAADRPAPHSELKSGELFQSISGTSMAAPHVAGAAALLTQLHPTFSSAALKSSLMTTARPAVVKEDGSTPATPFDMGSGEIDPNKAADPGLVLDDDTDDYRSYLEGVDPEIVAGDIPPTRPADLNLASISLSQLAGKDSTSRAFTSVDSVTKEWTVAIDQPPGVIVTADQSSFTIKPGTTKRLRLDFLVTTAPLDAYTFGALRLTDGSRTVRLPISVKPIAVAAPPTIRVTTDQERGAQAVTARAGYTGALSAAGWGIAPGVTKAGNRIDATSGVPDPSGEDPGTQVTTYDVPDGAQLFAARLGNVDGGDPNTDLDMYVYRDADGNGSFTPDEQVAASASGSADEHVELPFPDGGKYAVAVVGFTTRPGGSVYDLTTWTVDDASGDDAGNAPGISVSGDPVAVTPGTDVPLSLNWDGVTRKGDYLGVVTYHNGTAPDAGNRIGFSLVDFTKTTDTAAPAPPPSSGGTPGGTTVVPTPPSRAPLVRFGRAGRRSASFSVTCDSACTTTARLIVTHRVQRRLHLRALTVGLLHRSAKAGTTRFTVRITSRVVRAMRRAHTRTLPAVLIAQSVDGERQIGVNRRDYRIRT